MRLLMYALCMFVVQSDGPAVKDAFHVLLRLWIAVVTGLTFVSSSLFNQ